MKVLKEKIEKQLCLKSLKPTEDDLSKINQYTLEPLEESEIFAFKVMMGDNELDDRNDMPFSTKALKDLKALYPGKPFIMAHNHRDVKNLFARIYDTELITDNGRKTMSGEPYSSLIGKCYMARTSENEGLIADIKAGIKKEVSTGFSCKSLICSICGADNVKEPCVHWPGVTYKKDGTEAKCQMLIDGCSEAYELSLVTVGAQPRAGTIKAAEERTDPSEGKCAEENEKLRLELELMSL